MEEAARLSVVSAGVAAWLAVAVVVVQISGRRVGELRRQSSKRKRVCYYQFTSIMNGKLATGDAKSQSSRVWGLGCCGGADDDDEARRDDRGAQGEGGCGWQGLG
jgi:hypothetical protein